MAGDPFTAGISRLIWETKYRQPGEAQVADSWRRIAHALASCERDPAHWQQRFLDLLEDFRFLPGGRIQAGAGSGHRVTLLNCFVMGSIEDSLDGIFDGLKEGALTMQQGGGVGYDFSTLRPSGAPAESAGTIASGPVSFMQIWDAMCGTILSTGARRGAMMATLRCDHPDIEAFVDAKRDPALLRRFNVSVLVSDELMRAVERDEEWPLVFPLAADEERGGEVLERVWSGSRQPVPCRVHRRVSARGLWQRIMRATYDCAEPGVIFIDRVNRANNLWYAEHLSATNPCGEVPLPPYGACDLGSVNLTRFVREPFTDAALLDLDAVEAVAASAVRMLDNVYEVSGFPLPAQVHVGRERRRLGLGITGLADAMIMLGLRYGEPPSLDFAAGVMRRICLAAYRASVELAAEKGAFPAFDASSYLQGEFVAALPQELRERIRRHGIRNSHLIAIAPTGTISLLANNVSSGLEPVFEWRYRRRVRQLDGSLREFAVEDEAHRLWRALHGDAPLPPAFVTAAQVPPEQHLAMQAALQPWVDNSISKTINVPAGMGFDAFRDVYRLAWERGLKGCTTFRPNPVTGEVLSAPPEPVQQPEKPCCSIEREGD